MISLSCELIFIKNKMEQGEKNFELKNKEEKEININEKPIGDLLREQPDMEGLHEENKRTLKLFSEIEEIKTVLYAQFFSGKKRDYDYHLSLMSFSDLSESDRKNLDNVAGIFRELIFFANSERSVSENEINETIIQHELIMNDILRKMTNKKGYFVQYLGNTAQGAYYLGDVIKKQREEK